MLINKIPENNFNTYCRNSRLVFLDNNLEIPFNTKWKRIKSNSCYVTYANNIIFLKSYNTIVAQYNTDYRALKVYDYYSATTCQHVGKFQRYLRECGYAIDYIVYLYKRSDRVACIDNENCSITKWYKSLNK